VDEDPPERERWILTSSTPVDAAHGWVNPFEAPLRIDQICDIASWAWAEEAACKDSPPEMFFFTRSDLDRHRLTKLCNGCPVRADCLDHALVAEEVGWWGGTDDNDRKRLLRQLPQVKR
jgi:WhiB family redox-sensing transcriptional regulator